MAKTYWSEVCSVYTSRDGRVTVRPVVGGKKRTWSVIVDGNPVWSHHRLETAKQYGLEYRDGLHGSRDDGES
jgi:hypothetical protein